MARFWILTILILSLAVPSYANQRTYGDHYIDDDLIVDTSTLFVDSSTNRVGVGDTSPDYKLDVEGDLYVRNAITTDGLQFTSTSLTPNSEGLLHWNEDDGTLEVGMPGGNVVLQVGQENIMKVKASEDISNGEVVYIDGASGTNPTVSLALANAATYQATDNFILLDDMGLFDDSPKPRVNYGLGLNF